MVSRSRSDSKGRRVAMYESSLLPWCPGTTGVNNELENRGRDDEDVTQEKCAPFPTVRAPTGRHAKSVQSSRNERDHEGSVIF